MLQRFRVLFEYPVHFTRDAWSPDNPVLLDTLGAEGKKHRSRAAVVIDSGVLAARPPLTAEVETYFDRRADRIELASPPLIVQGGEAVKNDPEACSALERALHELALDRHSYVVIIGGGAVLDMAGFAASLTHRGLRVVRFPTTVLAQADSGVGVKNGVNAFGRKNSRGVFAPPFAVINDRTFLETLDRRDRISGMAEAVKVACIRDPELFVWLSLNAERLRCGELDPLAELIERSAALHLRHIASSGDPFEAGSARPLDFGHWSAHRLESMTDFRLRHGEAVAIGIALDTVYSASAGMMAAADRDRVLDLLVRLGLPIFDPALLEVAPAEPGRLAVLAGLDEFRVHLGGELTLTLLARIGRGVEVHEMSGERIGRSVEWLAERSGALQR